jgi:hypothetical protein
MARHIDMVREQKILRLFSKMSFRYPEFHREMRNLSVADQDLIISLAEAIKIGRVSIAELERAIRESREADKARIILQKFVGT